MNEKTNEQRLPRTAQCGNRSRSAFGRDANETRTDAKQVKSRHSSDIVRIDVEVELKQIAKRITTGTMHTNDNKQTNNNDNTRRRSLLPANVPSRLSEQNWSANVSVGRLADSPDDALL